MKCSQLLRLLQRDGWYIVSQRGSHVKMEHDLKSGKLIVPNHGSKEIGKGLEKSILKKAKIR
ncbi:MAG: type II toxin-antitoxin system HicA family toxin [Chitinophagales bacterium]|nr:type II toxin-antitoxin system HicA family toxin [Chitinophagales bacterium]